MTHDTMIKGHPSQNWTGINNFIQTGPAMIHAVISGKGSQPEVKRSKDQMLYGPLRHCWG